MPYPKGVPHPPERLTIVTYENKWGIPRLSVQMGYSFATKIALGDEEAAQKVIDAIATRVERIESGYYDRKKEEKERRRLEREEKAREEEAEHDE